MNEDEKVISGEADTPKPDDTQINKIAAWSKEGYQLIKRNKVDEARQAFLQILEIEDNNNYALVGLGDTERKANHFLEAVNYYRRCLESYPENNFALFGLADCYKALNMHDKAIGVWEQYLLHDDRNITVLTRVADSYRKIRDYQKAKKLYLRVLELEDNNAYALIGLGHLCYNFNEYNEALYYWTRILQLDAEVVDIRVLTSVGNCYRKLKKYAEGIKYFEDSLKQEPHNFYALFGLADCYRGTNQLPRSIEYWNRIIELDPKNKLVLTRMGDAYRSLKNYDEAAICYNQALDIEFDAYALMGLALISAETGNIDDALARLNRLIQNDKTNHRVYIEAANCYLRIGKRKDAVSILKEYLAQGIHSQTVSDMIENIDAGIL
jgi:tetratricopeptide (TPR) repeat protein